MGNRKRKLRSITMTRMVEDGDWLTVAQMARNEGVTRSGVLHRVDRKKLEARALVGLDVIVVREKEKT